MSDIKETDEGRQVPEMSYAARLDLITEVYDHFVDAVDDVAGSPLTWRLLFLFGCISKEITYLPEHGGGDAGGTYDPLITWLQHRFTSDHPIWGFIEGL